MKIDLHVHSSFSDTPSNWILRKFGCPESCTEPSALYRIAKARGMSMVTITDHDVIEGCLKIAHLPDTFVSEEVSVFFPEDGCKIHLLVFDIDEQQHREIQYLSRNIFELVDYLTAEQIVHSVAHPLSAVNGLLTSEHLEKMLLLFKNFELSGAKDAQVNQSLKRILARVSPEYIEHLVEKHQWTPRVGEPWKKNLTGGSDDHTSLTIANMHTEVEGADSLQEFFNGLEQGDARVCGRSATPQTLAYNIYGLGFQYIVDKFQLGHLLKYHVVFRFLNRFLQAIPKEESGSVLGLLRPKYLRTLAKHLFSKATTRRTVIQMARREIKQLIVSDPRLRKIAEEGIQGSQDAEKEWFQFVNRISSTMLFHLNHRLEASIRGMNPFDFFHLWNAGGVLYFSLVPYFVAYFTFARDRYFSRQILSLFSKHSPNDIEREDSVKVACFCDSMFTYNDVAWGDFLSQLQEESGGKRECVSITCEAESYAEEEKTHNFGPINIFELSEAKGKHICYPPLLEIIEYCFRENFTHIYSGTPGVMGLAALLTARILKLPIVSSYQSGLSRRVGNLTQDSHFDEVFGGYLTWYYGQMDRIRVPSKASALELAREGVNPSGIEYIPTGVDTRRFQPSKGGDGFLAHHFGIGEGRKLIYVGRIARTQNLPLLAGAFNTLHQTIDSIHLIVVGTGPYLEEMREAVSGRPCHFLGELEGEDLACVYASSDIFVFPGDVEDYAVKRILEAQASGLPVVTCDGRKPREHMIPRTSGLLLTENNERSLSSTLQILLADPQRLDAMGEAARRFAVSRSLDNTPLSVWTLFETQPFPNMSD